MKFIYKGLLQLSSVFLSSEPVRSMQLNVFKQASLLATTLFISTQATAQFDYQVYEGNFDALPNFDALSPIATGQSSVISTSVTSEVDTLG